MPIYKQTYRTYDGKVRRRFRWAIIVEQEWNVLSNALIFKFMFGLGSIHILLRVLQIWAHDLILQDPYHPLAPYVSRIPSLDVGQQMYLEFMRIQYPLVFLMMIYAGAGMICNDVRNNLWDMYFSKPITWKDYAIGKLVTLLIVGFTMTAIPAVGFSLLHLIFIPTWDNFVDYWSVPLRAVGCAVLYVVPLALGILAASSVLPTMGYAAITVFMIITAESAMAVLLAQLLREPNYLVISLPMAIDRAALTFLGDERPLFNLPRLSFAYVALVCVFCLAIYVTKVRRAEGYA